MRNVKAFTITLVAICCAVNGYSQKEPWIPLFNGESLNGWHTKNGKAKYRIEDKAIVGMPVTNSPNTFLCTDKEFSDFILELEFKLDGKLNSGVQFRTNSFPENKDGTPFGYQCEIDPSDRKWTGGIYDEARRGWLYPLAGDEAAQNAYRHLEWNSMRIEAVGSTIKTWINDIPVSHLEDDRTASGFFGLQVHAIGTKEEEKNTVRWRNIRIITDNPEKYSRKTTQPVKKNLNKLTSNEQNDGWKLLFDGATSKGWRGAKLNQFPAFGWTIENGELTINESGGAESDAAGDIVTIKKYENFILQADVKITPGANSGIKYYVDTELNKGPGSSIGLEYQILDDELHPDAKLGSHEGSRTMASLYDLIKAENKHLKAIGAWNNIKIVSLNNHVEHWLNDRKVLEYERGSKAFRKLVSNSKYKKWSGFGELKKGHILLQDHGNRVSYRNIKIKEL